MSSLPPYVVDTCVLAAFQAGDLLRTLCGFPFEMLAPDLVVAEFTGYEDYGVQAVDLTKWDRKGIAKISVTANGASYRLTLDDWYFKGMGDLLTAVREQRPNLFPPEPVTPTPSADASPTDVTSGPAA